MKLPLRLLLLPSKPVKWVLGLLLCAGCATPPPRTIEQAQRQYERNKARARGNPTLVPYFPKPKQ